METPPIDQEPTRNFSLGLTVETFRGTPTTPTTLHPTGGNVRDGSLPRFSFSSRNQAVQLTDNSVSRSEQPTIIYLGERDSITSDGSRSDDETTPSQPDHLAASTIAPSLPASGPVQRRPTSAGSPNPSTETVVSVGGSSGGSSPNRGTNSPSQHSPVRSPIEPPSPPSLDKDDSGLCTKFFKAVCECCCGSKKNRG